MNFKGPDLQGGLDYSGSLTIAEALKKEGYVSSVALDPQTRKTDVPDTRDYVLVRCNKGGDQSKGKYDETFAVWTDLEGTIKKTEADNASGFCGGSGTGATGVRFGYASTGAEFFAAPATANDEQNRALFASGNSRANANPVAVVKSDPGVIKYITPPAPPPPTPIPPGIILLMMGKP
jgi:hypothetical protein